MPHGPIRMHLLIRKRITIDVSKCVGCQLCMKNCPVGTVIAYADRAQKAYVRNSLACGGCGACLRGCPVNAIHILEEHVQSDGICCVSEVRAPGQPKHADASNT